MSKEGFPAVSQKTMVGVVFGGKSGEHEISVVSAMSIMAALSDLKYDVIPIGITKDGKWIIIRDKNSLSQVTERGFVAEEDGIDAQLKDLQAVDVFFPVLHGTYGEDGAVQGFFEMIGKAYVGSGVLASSLAMDKAMAKTVMAKENIPVVDHVLITKKECKADLEGVIRRIEGRLKGYPVFIKPANLGSSVGISKARNRKGLIDGIHDATLYDTKILVEEAVDCREIECSVLGNDEPVASVPGEIIPSREFYDYVAKYIDNRSKLLVPAPLEDPVTEKIKDLAVRAFRTLGCSGMARVDFLLSKPGGRVYVSEVNTIPGFTSISMYPRLWEHCGLAYPELVDRLVGLGLERFRERAELKTTYSPGEQSSEATDSSESF